MYYLQHVPNYRFEWAVRDNNNNNFGQFENRVGGITTGGYSVSQPDGRLQTVSYRTGDPFVEGF